MSLSFSKRVAGRQRTTPKITPLEDSGKIERIDSNYFSSLPPPQRHRTSSTRKLGKVEPWSPGGSQAFKQRSQKRASSMVYRPDHMSSEEERHSCGVISPESNFQILWTVVLFFACIVAFTISIYFETFGILETSLQISLLLDGIFLTNILLRALFFVIRRKNGDISTRPEITKAYIKSAWFVCDFVTFIPLTTLGILQGQDSIRLAGSYLRLCSLFRLNFCIENMFEILHSKKGYSNTSLHRMTNLFISVFLLSVAGGCVHYRISYNANEKLDFPESNLTHPFSFQEDDLNNDFILAVYFSVTTLFTVGYGDHHAVTVPELYYGCFFMIVGMIIHSLVIANMTTLLTNLDAAGNEFKQKLEKIQTFLLAKDVSIEMQEKVRRYFQYLWKRQKGRLEEEILQEIPVVLRESIMFGKRSSLYKVAYFRDRDVIFIDSILACLDHHVLLSGELLCKQDEPCATMWFLSEGNLEIILEVDVSNMHEKPADQPAHHIAAGGHKKGKKRLRILDTIVPGQHAFVGEQMLCEDKPIYNFTVRATVISELLQLDKDVLDFVIDKCKLFFEVPDDSTQKSNISQTESQRTDITENKEYDLARGKRNSKRMRMKLESMDEVITDKFVRRGSLVPIEDRNQGSCSSNEARPDPLVFNESLAPRGKRRSSVFSLKNEHRQSISQYLGPTKGNTTSPIPIANGENGPIDLGIIATQKTYRTKVARLERIGNNHKLHEGDSGFHFSDRMFDKVNRYCNKTALRIQMVLTKKGVRPIWDFIIFLAFMYLSIIVPVKMVFSMDVYGSFWVSISWQWELVIDAIIFMDLAVIPLMRNAESSEKAKDPDKNSKVDKVANQISTRNVFQSVWESRSPNGRKFYALLLASSLVCSILMISGEENTILLAAVRIPFVLCFLPLIQEATPRLALHFSFVSVDSIGFVGLQVLLTLIVVTQWIACGWIYFESPSSKAYNLTYNESMIEYTALDNSYLTANYWTWITITTVGFGDITPEMGIGMLYTAFVMIFGVTLYAGFISILIAITRNAQVFDDRIEHFKSCLKTYLLEKNYSSSLQKECNEFMEYVEHDQNLLGDTAYNLLPSSLQVAVMNENIRDPILARCAIFKDVPSDILDDLVRMLHHEVFLPRATIASSHSTITLSPENRGIRNSLILIESGTAHILSEKDVLLGQVNARGNYGAMELFEPETLHSKLVAVSVCRIWYLSKSSFDYIMSQAEIFEKSNKDIEDDATAISIMLGTMKECAMRSSIQGTKNAGKLAKLNGATEEVNNGAEAKYEPNSKIQKAWKLTMFIFIMYNICSFPYRVCFLVGSAMSQNIVWFLLDYIGDLATYCNIIFRFNFFQVQHGSTTLKTKSEIRAEYKKRDLALDLISILPLDIILLLTLNSCSIQLYTAARITRLFRLYRISHLISIIREFVPIRQNFQQLILLLASTMLFAHWGGCLFFYIARVAIEENPGVETWVSTSGDPLIWLEESNSSDTTNVFSDKDGNAYELHLHEDAYMWSLYWAVTVLTTVGYGDYHPVRPTEVIFSIFLVLFSGTIYAFILSSLEEIVAQSDIASILFQRRMDELNDYLVYRKLPKEIVQKVNKHMDSLWERYKGVDENWVQEKLPLTLRRKLRMETLGMTVLKKVPIFSTWKCEETLLDLLKPVVYYEGEVLFLKEEIPLRLFFVASGKVEFKSDDGSKVFISFMQGNVFGEPSFFFNETAECAAVAKENTDLFILSRSSFDEFLNSRPDLKAKFETEILEIEDDLRKRCSLEGFQRNMGKAKVGKFFQEDENDDKKNNNVLISPASRKRKIWNILIFLTFFYNWFSLIFRIAFYIDIDVGESLPLWFIVDVAVDILFLIDMYLRARRFAFVLEGRALWTREETMSQYLRKSLLLDLVIIFPLNIIYFAATPTSTIGMVAAYRLNRCFLLFRSIELFKYLDSLLEEFRILVKSCYRQLLKMFIFSMLFVHLAACIRSSYNAKVEGYSSMGETEVYIHNLYWSIYTVSTVGYGSEHVEYPYFAIVIMVLGAFIFDAGVTATLGNMLANNDSRMGVAKSRKDAMVQYMKSRHIEKTTQASIMQYLEYCMKIQKNIDEQGILAEASLPINLRIEIVTFCALDLVPNISAHPLFFLYSKGLMQTVALMLQPMIFPSNHCILKDISTKTGSTLGSVGTIANFSAQAQAAPKDKIAPASGMINYYAMNLRTMPSYSVEHAGNANVGFLRDEIEMSDDNIYFLSVGKVLINLQGHTKVIRRGLVAHSSGIEAARTISVCETFVLGVQQYMFLTRYENGFGKFESFLEVLETESGMAQVKNYCKRLKIPDSLARLSLWSLINEHSKIKEDGTEDLAYSGNKLANTLTKNKKNSSNNSIIEWLQTTLTEEKLKTIKYESKVNPHPDSFKEVQKVLFDWITDTISAQFRFSFEFSQL